MDFLNSDLSRKLYNYVSNLPIIDYHNHLSVNDIKTNKRFFDIYDLWIKPDPYKHRAMRMCGVEEEFITGNMPEKEKFIKWCTIFPKLIGNPIYYWSLMELKKVFSVNEIPNSENAEKIYNACNQYLKENNVTAESLLKRFNVEMACPCASLIDDISFFYDNQFSPSLRGDDIVNITASFLEKLKEISKIDIRNINDFKKAIHKRLDEFQKCGCVFADHALDNGFQFFKDDNNNEFRFKLMLENKLENSEQEKLSSYILTFLAEEYAKRGLVMQLHIGAQRYTSTRLRNMVGPQGGFAGIGNSVDVKMLTDFLDTVDQKEYGLPKTVLFTLNPSDNALISVLSGSYSKDGVSGIITQGPAWWWCDHKKGIEDMLENTAAFSVLSNFIGMTTDSRSFLSFVRHDYFRQIVCNFIASKIENGEYPCCEQFVEELLKQLCYQNAKEIFCKKIKGENYDV